MSRKALVVFTYSGQQQMLERHLPFFRKGGADIILVSPRDEPVTAPDDCTALNVGSSEHYGQSLMQRMNIGIKCAAADYDTIAVVEGDSIVLGPIHDAQPEGIDCFLYDSEQPPWKAPHYVHWPWLMSRKTAMRVAAEFHTLISLKDIERGFPDRMLGYAAHRAGIPLRHRPDITYSRNLIDTPEYVAQARDAIAGGAVFVHGVKTQAHLDAILK